MNKEADEMADYVRRVDHYSASASSPVQRPRFLLAKFDGSVRDGKMGSGWVLYAADTLNVDSQPKWVPSAACCVPMPGVAASVMVSELLDSPRQRKPLGLRLKRKNFVFLRVVRF